MHLLSILLLNICNFTSRNLVLKLRESLIIMHGEVTNILILE